MISKIINIYILLYIISFTPINLISEEFPSSLRPHEMQDMVVHLEVTLINGDIRSGVAIPFRLEKNTLYLITAFHLLDNSQENITNITLTFHGNTKKKYNASILWINPIYNLGILKIDNFSINSLNTKILIRKRGYAVEEIKIGDRLYALGCILGECWHLPEECRLQKFRDDIYIQIRSPYLEPGLSGGPLLDNEGAIVGMILHSAANLGEAISWDFIDDYLNYENLPINIYTNKEFRLGEFIISAEFPIIPLPPKDLDDKRLSPSFRISSNVLVNKYLLCSFGIQRMVYKSWFLGYSNENDRFLYHSAFFGGGIVFTEFDFRGSINLELHIPDKVSGLIKISDMKDIDYHTGIPKKKVVKKDYYFHLTPGFELNLKGDWRINERIVICTSIGMFFPKIDDEEAFVNDVTFVLRVGVGGVIFGHEISSE